MRNEAEEEARLCLARHDNDAFVAALFQTAAVLLTPAVAPLLAGRTVLCLCSGSPEQARAFGTDLAARAAVGLFVSGCYAGGPAQAAAGAVGGSARRSVRICLHRPCP